MIHFNELYVTEDSKEIVIDVEIDDLPEYDDCYVDEINVCIAADCAERSPFDKYVTVWKPPTYFDLNGDKTYSNEDLAVIKTLLQMTVAHVDTTDSHQTDYSGVYKDSTGYYYYLDEGNVDAEDNPVYSKKRISYDVFSKWAYIVDTYYESEGDASLLTFCLCMYLSESLEPFVYEIVSGGIPYTGVRGDLNGDTDVNVADINRLIRFLENNDEETIADLLRKRIKHIRICVNASNLAGLGILPNEPLDKLFYVKANAFCLTEAAVNTTCGCDSSEITGVAYNGLPVYNNIINTISNALGNNSCDLSDFSSFEDLMLNYYGFKFAVECGDLCSAYNHWANLIGHSSGGFGSSKSCGCHGTY